MIEYQFNIWYDCVNILLILIRLISVGDLLFYKDVLYDRGL